MARNRSGRRPGWSPAPVTSGRRRFRFRPVAWTILAVVVVLGGRWWFAPATDQAVDSHITTPYLVVVGTEEHDYLADVDRQVVDTGSVQVGVLRVPTGDDQCAAAGWASLSAGAVTETGSICRPEVTADGAIADWHELQDAAAGRLGGLADEPGSCVAAVGAPAALGATRSDGTVSVYQDFAQFAGGGFFLSCPITLVAAPSGTDADTVVSDLATRENVTVIRVGLGPDRSGRVPQVLYRTATTLPGLSTGRSASTAGVIDLTDLAEALRTFHAEASNSAGAPLQVVEGSMGQRQAQELLNELRTLADRETLQLVGLSALLAAAGIVAVVGLGLRKGWPSVVAVAVAAAVTTWPGALINVGFVPWWATDAPVTVVLATSAALILVLSVIVVLVHRRRPEWPVWLIGTGLSLTMLLVHASWAAPARLGSVLDRWDLTERGVGSAAVAVLAVAVLVVLGQLGTLRWPWLLGVVIVLGVVGMPSLGGSAWLVPGVAAGAALVLWLLKLAATHPVYRVLGAGWVTLVVAVVVVAAVGLRTVDSATVADWFVLAVGLLSWTGVHGWLVPGDAGPDLDLAALRVPVLVAVGGVAIASLDPAWAWAMGSVFFASIAAAAFVLRRSVTVINSK